MNLTETFPILGRMVFVSLIATAAFAAVPVIQTVPANPANPAQAHETWSGRDVTLKATSSLAGVNISASWDFGDGTQPASFPVTNGSDVSARHTYFAAAGSTFTAHLTVTDTSSGDSAAADYPVVVEARSLNLDVRIASDEALWYLYKSLNSDATHATTWQVAAFVNQGHLPSGNVSDPYTNVVNSALGALSTHPNDLSDDPSWHDALAVKSSADALAFVSHSAGAQVSNLSNSTLSGRPNIGSQLLALEAQGIGRPDSRWIQLEASLRNQQNLNLATDTLFLVARALRNQVSGGVVTPLVYIQSEQLGPLDWYNSDSDTSSSIDGVARSLVNRQQPDGSFDGNADSTAKALLTFSPQSAQAVPVSNVSASFSVTHTAYVLNRVSGKYTSNLTITNTSGNTVTGPFSVGLLSISSGATLVNGAGSFNGAPYVTNASVSLAPGGSATLQLQFTIVPGTVINFTPVVYAGAFPPGILSVGCPANTATLNSLYSSTLTASGGVLTYSFSINPGSLPHNLSINPATGAITGTPDTAGPSTFTAVVTDSAGGTPETANTSCTITVSSGNQAPVAAPQTVSTNENTALPLTLSGTDADGNALTFAIVTPPSNGGLGSLGSPSCTGNPSTCTAAVTYTPGANYNGPDSFTFKVNDGTVDSNVATISITVHPVNSQPTANAQSVTTNQDTAKGITLTGSDLETASANLTFTVTQAPAHGTLSGTAPNLTYTPAAGYSGPDSFNFKVTDRGDPDNCGAVSPTCAAPLDSTSATVSITVSPVNTAPTATPQNVTTNQDTAKGITLAGTDAETLPANLSFTVTANPAHGTLSGTAPNLTYTPAAGYFGNDAFAFTVTDRGKPDNCGAVSPTCAAALTSAPATVGIIVSPVNTPPTATPQTLTTNKNVALPITLAGTDLETAPANLSFTVTANPTHGTLSGTAPNVTYTPAANYTGADSFQFKVTDRGKPDNCGAVSASCAGALQSSAATISITVNDPPAITSGAAATFAPGKTGQTFTVTTTGFPSGASMAISAGAGFPSGVSLADNHDGTATVSGTPAAGTQGVIGTPPAKGYPVVITANNGITPNGTQNFTLTVACPSVTVSGPAPLSLTFGTAMSAASYSQSNGNGTIAWTVSGQPTGLSINPSTGQITGTPSATGTFATVVTASDAGGCVGTQSFNIAVAPNAPNQTAGGVGNTQFYVSGVAGAPSTPAVVSPTGLLNGVTPASTSVTGAGCSAGGTINFFDGFGRFIFTPALNSTGATCTYTTSSDTGNTGTPVSVTKNLTITLTNRVWYVDNATASVTNDGRSNTPLKTMPGGGVTGAGDFIYVAKGSGNTTGAYSLLGSQSLIGAGATLSVGGILSVTGNTANTPTLSGGLSATGVTGLTVNGISESTTGSTAAVNLVNSDGSFTFQSISAIGGGTGTNGIIWNNATGTAATGSFTVNGDGANTTQGGNSSGGTISGMSGSDGSVAGTGIYLNNVANVALNRMTVNGVNQNYGIRGINIGGFALNYSTVNGTNGTSNSADPDVTTSLSGEGSVRFTNLTGTAAIQSCVLDGGFARTATFYTNAGTLSLTIDSSIVRDLLTNALTTDSMMMQAINGSTINLTVTNSSFTAYRQYGIETDARGTATMSINISGSTFENNNTSPVSGAGSLSLGSSNSTDTLVQFNIHNNSFRHGSATVTAPSNGGAHLVAGTVSGAGKFDGKFQNNTVGVTGVVNSASGAGADALRLFASGNLSATNRVTLTTDTRYLVTGNTILNYGEVGIQFNARQGNSTLDATVFGNTIEQPGTAANGAFGAIWANSGVSSGDTNTLNIVIGDAVVSGNKNTMTNSDPSAASDVFLENDSASGPTLNLYKNGSSSTTVANILTDDNNPTLHLSGATSGTIGLVAGVPPTVP